MATPLIKIGSSRFGGGEIVSSVLDLLCLTHCGTSRNVQQDVGCTKLKVRRDSKCILESHHQHLVRN